MKTIYRAEAIGSLLRPAYLRDARRSLRSKEKSTEQFKKIEDRAVDEMIALQEAAGLDVVTHGEIGRVNFIRAPRDVVSGLRALPGQLPLPDRRKLVAFKMWVGVGRQARWARLLVD